MKKIFIAGSSYFIDKNIEMESPGSEEADVEIFFGDEINKSDFFAFINSVGMFGNEKAAIIRNAAKIKDLADFVRATEKCSESSIIACAEFPEKPDAKIIKIFKDAGYIIKEEEKKKSGSPSAQVLKIFESKGMKISFLNAEKIAAQCHGDMTAAENEAEKISLYLFSHSDKSPDDLMEYISGDKEDTIFSLIDAFGDKNRKKTFEILKNIPFTYENCLKIFFGIARRITNIYYSFISQNLVEGKFDFQKQIVFRQKQNWKRKEAAAMIGHMAKLDFEIKTGRKTFENAIEEVLAALSPDIL